MAIDVTQDLGSLFSHKAMQEMARYMNTYNMATQAIAVDGNAYDIQSTGTGWAMVNGQPEQIEVDAALDISATASTQREITKTAWAVSTSYSVGDIRWNSDGIRFRCITAHTSRDGSDSNYINNEPGKSDNWAYYWEEAPHAATYAAGSSIADGSSQWFLVTAEVDGTLGIWEAGDAGTSTTFECPQFDPKLYIPVGAVLYANAAGDSAADVIGNASTCDFSTYGTFVQLIGPVFPKAGNFDKN